jgi:arylsulfatase
MTHYSGAMLGALRFENFKVHIKPAQGGLPGMEFYNVKRDPGEKFGKMYPGLFAVAPIQMFIGKHMGMVQKFPHRDPSESRAKH